MNVLEPVLVAMALHPRPSHRQPSDRSTARQTVGEKVELIVGTGGSEQFWPHGLNWGRSTAQMLGDYNIRWFE